MLRTRALRRSPTAGSRFTFARGARFVGLGSRACDLARERLDPEAGHVLAVSRDVRQALTLVLRQAIVEGGVRHGTRCVEGTVSEAASDDQKRADSDGVPTGDWAPSSICI